MLTKKQKECYDALRDYKAKHGIIPSYDELMVILNLKSKSGIHRLIVGLEERGAIRRLRNRARAIRIIPLD